MAPKTVAARRVGGEKEAEYRARRTSCRPYARRSASRKSKSKPCIDGHIPGRARLPEPEPLRTWVGRCSSIAGQGAGTQVEAQFRRPACKTRRLAFRRCRGTGKVRRLSSETGAWMCKLLRRLASTSGVPSKEVSNLCPRLRHHLPLLPWPFLSSPRRRQRSRPSLVRSAMTPERETERASVALFFFRERD